MNSRLLLLFLCLHSPAILCAALPPELHAFMETHCFECHDADVKKGGLDLTVLPADFRSITHAETWLNVMDQLNSGEMPPKKRARPPQSQVTALVEWIAGQLRTAEAGSVAKLRRLSRYEYERTVSDLFGIRYTAPPDFPEDPTQFGFDNNAGALAISPTHLEKFMAAADEVLSVALGSGKQPANKTVTVKIAGMNNSTVMPHPSPERIIVPPFASFNLSGPRLPARIPRSGDYVLRLRVAGTRGSKWPHPPRATLHLNGAVVFDAAVTAPESAPQTFEVPMHLRAGEADFILINGGTLPLGQAISQPKKLKPDAQQAYAAEVPCLVLEAMTLEGPLHAQWPPASRARVFFKDGASPREVLEHFMPRAYRRPVTPDEVQRVLSLVEAEVRAGESLDSALHQGLRAVLTSPHFIFLAEPPGRVDDYALANRLSYFLWSTMPDEALFSLAAKNVLREPATLQAQVTRMLADPRAASLTENFAVQWLELRRAGSFAPDRYLFPNYDDHLERAMVAETKAFFREVLTRDLSVRSFLDSDWAMLNERMARHYGIAGVTHDDFRRVALPPSAHRGGVLMQASILSLTSDGTRTKPVDRGKWVLDNLLGTPPPPPPPNAGQLPNIPEFSRLPLRQRIEKHRQIESCAACHAKIDPFGLALENYDAIGAWRDTETLPDETPPDDLPRKKKKRQSAQELIAAAQAGREIPINPASVLADGRAIADATALRRVLVQDEDKFLRCLTEKMLTYALGRGLRFSDRETVTQLQAALKSEGTLRSLITRVVLSDAFQTK